MRTVIGSLFVLSVVWLNPSSASADACKDEYAQKMSAWHSGIAPGVDPLRSKDDYELAKWALDFVSRCSGADNAFTAKVNNHRADIEKNIEAYKPLSTCDVAPKCKATMNDISNGNSELLRNWFNDGKTDLRKYTDDKAGPKGPGRLERISAIKKFADDCKCFIEAIGKQNMIDPIEPKLQEAQAEVDKINADKTAAKEKLEQQLAQRQKDNEEAHKQAELIAKMSQTPSCKKSYSFMHYCKNTGMLKAAQNQLKREKELANRSGYVDKLEVRRWTNAIMEMEKAVANAKTSYNKFGGSAPPLSACTVVKDEGNNFVPDTKTQKKIDDSLQKNCGTTDPQMEF